MTMKWRKPRRAPIAEIELNLVEIKCAFCKGKGVVPVKQEPQPSPVPTLEKTES